MKSAKKTVKKNKKNVEIEEVTAVSDTPNNSSSFEGLPLDMFLTRLKMLSAYELRDIANKYEIPFNASRIEDSRARISNFAKKSNGIDLLAEKRTMITSQPFDHSKDIFAGLKAQYGIK